MNVAFAIATLFALIPSSNQKAEAPPAGDYVEARTASVFAGPCHYNGELVTTGDDAIMAWNFTTGQWHGTDISGVRVMAVVSSDSNLSDPTAARKCELLIDSSATPSQATAVVSAILSKDAATLGNVTAIHRAPVKFQHAEDEYVVEAVGFGSINVQAMPDMACC